MPENAARESSGEEASKHTSARTSQLDVEVMTCQSNNVFDNIETGKHEASARKSKGASMHAAHARTLLLDVTDQTGRSSMNLAGDYPWRPLAPTTSWLSLTPLLRLTHQSSLASSLESKG